MKRMSVQELLALHGRSESDHHLMQDEWDDLAKLIRPSMGGMISPHQPGEKRTERIFDSTAPQAVSDLSNFLSAALTPSASAWLDLSFRDGKLSETKTAAKWLQDCTEVMRTEILNSNFYAAFSELYADAVTFGTGVVQADGRYDQLGKFEGLHFESVWIKEVTALANQYGDLTTTFRCYEQTALQWAGKFGKDVGERLLKISGEKPETPVKFLHVVYPRDLADIDREGVMRGIAQEKKMPFASVWINLMDKVIVKEGGFMELPRYVVRWAKASNSIWGYGPGHLALPDIRTLNEAVRLELEAWERSIDRPMVTSPNNLMGDLNLGPGGLTVARRPQDLRPLTDATDFTLTAIKTDELRASILRTFYADLIREPSEMKSGTTAYEVAKRIERAQRILGETVGHLQSMLKWVVERSFQILFREGRLPPAPEGLLELGPKIDVRYISPLRQSQEAQGVEQLTLFIGDVAQMAAIQQQAGEAPTALDWVNWDGAVEELAKRRNAWAAALNTEGDVQAIREERQQAQQAAAQAEQAANAAKAVRDVGAGVGADQALRLVNGA
jgi:hypothetical protein